jgi:hypothetical protein
MAHWAEVDKDNIVLRVLVTDNDLEDEGYSWLVDSFGGTWIKTSYNTYAGEHRENKDPFRYNFACPGFIWDESIGKDGAFIPPKPDGEGWTLNPEKQIWVHSSFL